MSRKAWIANKALIIVLSSLIGFCGVGMIVAGVRTKKKQWKIWGWAYLAIGTLMIVTPLVAFYGVIWIVSIIHTIRISSEYCMRLKVIGETKDILKQQELKAVEKKVATIYEELTGTKREDEDFENQQEVKKIQKIDINTCTEMELSAIPGIGLILAKRIVDIRRDKKFVSVEDFYKRLGIEEDRQRIIGDYLVCSYTEAVVEQTEETEPKIKGKSSQMSGRKIDL